MKCKNKATRISCAVVFAAAFALACPAYAFASEGGIDAIAELQASVADIACAAMTRVVQEDFTDADHRRLIEKSLEEIGTLNA